MANSYDGLKSGFLVKKGRTSHRWKARWFILHESCLSYHRKADRIHPIGNINLSCATVVSPVAGYEKRQGVFKLGTKSGREYLLRAPTDEERDVWTLAIGAIIRQLEGMAQNESSHVTKQLSSRVNLSDVLGAMQDPDAGVTMATCHIEDVTYDNCFSGCTAVDWLLRWSFASSREAAACLLDDLIQLAHIQPLHNIINNTVKHKFHDSNKDFYRFSAWTRIAGNEVVFDSSSDDSDSSGELSEGDILDVKKKQGKIIKEGFLLKRGHLRKKWKARKIVLKDHPPTLEYFGASKDTEPLKTIPIDGAIVLDLSDEQKHDEMTASLSKKRQYVFCVRLQSSKILVFQAEDDHIREEWVKSLNKVCKHTKQ